mgnify:CR=1 FL=1
MPITTDNEKLALMEMQIVDPALPFAAGSPLVLDQAENQQLLWGYPGILWESPTGTAVPVIVHHLREQGIA